jgi:ParB-like chromosome segregation protein Spo0J
MPARTILPGDGVYRPHPYAELFPKLDGRALAELIEDIRQHGVREPIVMLDGMVLDGRNRYLAAREAGRLIPTRDFEGDDPLGYVISLNVHRRHLSDSQRALVAARLADMPQGARTDLAQISAKSQPQAAELLKVSRGSVQNAAKVIEHGTPALVSQVEAGNVSVSAAAKVAMLPDIEQQKIVAGGAKELVARATELRGANSALRNAGRKAAAKRGRTKLTAEEQAKRLAREEKRIAREEKRWEEDRLRKQVALDLIVDLLRERLSDQDKQLLAQTTPDLGYELQDLAKRVCAG